MYKVGDKLTLIKEFIPRYGVSNYTLNNSYKIMKIKNSDNDKKNYLQEELYYIENDNSGNNINECTLWGKKQLDIYFKNLRRERLEKLKQINENLGL